MLTQDDVVYQIVTDRFANGDPSNDGDVDSADPLARHGGDLAGVVEKMAYLRDLGVTVLWISPVYVNAKDGYHGYHVEDFEKVDPHLCSASLGAKGGREDVRRFVEIAHEHGLKVMLDVIVSHTAVDHPWLKERPDWFDKPGSSVPEKWWIWGLPNLNHENIDVNVYFARNVLDWIENTGADAIRIDAARHVEKAFWEIFKLFAKGIYPDVTIVGEVWDSNTSIVAPYQDAYDFDSLFDYPLYDAILDVFVRDAPFARIARPELSDREINGVLNQDPAYRNAYQLLTFVGNHDNPRFLQLAGEGRSPDEAWARMKLALSFLFTTRGIPQLYYGDELGMLGGADPDNRRDMAWNRVGGSDKRATEISDFVKKLIKLRRAGKSLCYGLLTTLYVTPTLYVFARTFYGDVRIVALNNSSDSVDAVVPIQRNERLSLLDKEHLKDGSILTDALSADGPTVRIEDGNIRVKLAARTAALYSPEISVTGRAKR